MNAQNNVVSMYVFVFTGHVMERFTLTLGRVITYLGQFLIQVGGIDLSSSMTR